MQRIPPASLAWVTIVAAAAYVVTAWLALRGSANLGLLPAVWPAGGVFLASLLRLPRPHWPWLALACAIGGMGAEFAVGNSPALGAVYVAAQIGQGLATAALLRRFAGAAWTFERLREGLGLIVFGVLLAPLTFGAFAAWAAASWSDATFGSAWLAWIVVQGSGVLLVAPVILTLTSYVDRLRDLHWARRLELACALGLLVILTIYVLYLLQMRAPRVDGSRGSSAGMILIPALLWILIRFGPAVMSVGLLLLIGLSVAGVWTGFVPVEPPRNVATTVLAVQGVTGTTVVTLLVFSCLLAERRRSFRDLESNDRLLRDIIEGVAEPLFVKDDKGNYVRVNSAFAAQLGLKVPEIIGQPDRKLLDPQRSAEIEAIDHEVMKSGQPRHYEYALQTGQGSRTFMLSKYPRRGRDGRVVGIIGLARDIKGNKGG